MPLAVPPAAEVHRWRDLVTEYALPCFQDHSCCLEMTRVLVELAHRQGYAARPLVVQVSIFNAAARALVAAGVSAQTPAGRAAWDAAGGWSVGIGYPDASAGPGRWPGHLVALVADAWLIDCTLTQADRPAYGVRLAALALPLPDPSWLTSPDRPLPLTYGPTLVVYYARPGDRSYRAGRGWQAAKTRPIVDQLITHLARQEAPHGSLSPL